METSAELKASKEFEKIAELWPDEVWCAEQQLTHEEEAAELVHNFLIPEVNPNFNLFSKTFFNDKQTASNYVKQTWITMVTLNPLGKLHGISILRSELFS